MGECSICIFPYERSFGSRIDSPWYKLYNNVSYNGAVTNLSVAIHSYHEIPHSDAYKNMYEMFIDILTFIATIEASHKINKMIANALVYKHQWYSINDGAIYAHGSSPTPNQLTYYNFDGWSIVSYDDIVEYYEVTHVKQCKDPREEYWEHFIKIDHQKEIMYKEKVNNYVSEVFEKVRNHASIPIEARMALIHDMRDVDKFIKIRKQYKLIGKHFSIDKLQKLLIKNAKT